MSGLGKVAIKSALLASAHAARRTIPAVCARLPNVRTLPELNGPSVSFLPNMNKAKVLVVDDDPKLSTLTRLVLEKTQIYEVCEVNRPTQALGVARTFRPDCVLLDVDMPGKSGGEVACDFAADPTLRDVPVMFFTSLVSKAEAGEREVLRGGKRFLAKPINPAALIGAVGRLLGGDAAVDY